MAGLNKKISDFDDMDSPALSGNTIYDDGIDTYKLSLDNLINMIIGNNGIIYTREILDLPIPLSGDTISVTTTAIDTIVSFTGNTSADFIINIISSSGTTKGDRVYVMTKGTGGVITFTGNINPILCGNTDFSWTVTSHMSVLEFIFDGTNFTGIDNC